MMTAEILITGIQCAVDRYAIVISIAILATVYLIGSALYDVYLGPLSKYPGPKAHAFSVLPSIRTMALGNDNTDYTALHAKYGAIVRTGPKSISYANGAEGFNDIYGFSKKGLYKDPVFYGKPFNDVHTLVEGNDTVHGRQRKILSPAFSDRVLKEQMPLLKHWANLMRTRLQEQAVVGKKVDVSKFYNCTTFDIMGDLIFAEGLDMLEDSEYSPWVKMVFKSIKQVTKFRALRLYSRLTNWLIEECVFKSNIARKIQREHWDFTRVRVDRRLARTPDRPDLWTRTLDKNSGPESLSLDEHYAIASFLMIAGTETTATALSGTTYHLLQNPSTLAQLSREIRSAFPHFGDISLEGLARQKYLQAVLQEGLRMYPPIPIMLPRLVPTGGAIICGDWVPGGVTVGVHHLATYMSEEHFRKPYEFHPERWLGDPEFKDDHLDALQAFSVGPRNCLGQNLAWHEMRLLLATVVLQFDMKLAEESKDWSNQKVFSVWEKKPLLCSLTSVRA